MPRRVNHAKIKVGIFGKRNNLIRENLDLRKRLADTELAAARAYEPVIRAKDDEIASLMTVIRREQDARKDLTDLLQELIMEKRHE